MLNGGKHNDTKINTTDINEDRRIAGFFGQLRILLWKNIILSKRNICGLLSEILLPIVLIGFLLLIRYFVDVVHYDDQLTRPGNIIDLLPYNSTTLKLLYYPDNAFIQGIVVGAAALINMRKPFMNISVEPSAVSDGSSLDNATIASLLGLISFPDTYLTAFPDDVQYKIFTQELSSSQYKVDTNFYSKKDYMFSRAPEYYCLDSNNFMIYNRFNGLKHALDLKIIQKQTGEMITTNNPMLVKTMQIPCPEYNKDELKARFSFFLPIIIDIVYVLTVLVTIRNMINEKETKMREYLKLIGIKWYAIWFSWFIRSMVIYTILTLLISAIGLAPLQPRNKNDVSYIVRKMFAHTNFFVTFSTFFVYSIQVSCITIFISQIFSRPFIAQVTTFILWIATAINFYDSLPRSSLKYLFCIFPNAGMTFSFQAIFQYERSSKQLSYPQIYSNIFGDDFNLGSILACMLAYSVLYLVIAWYLERIMPGEYGAALPFYFPFMPSYWFESKQQRSDNVALESREQRKGFEDEPANQSASVSIENISKEFRSGFSKKTVVNNMSLKFYENQVTGLLGHNGAGKTTTTFMLCGIYAPTSGTAKILNHDIVMEMDKIRTSLGFCPQYNILYDELTVGEHLKLIAMVKGYKTSEIQAEMIQISTFVGLQNDLNTQSRNLSGGMKRRLSMAMALIGDSKVIILDEPTSGLDPFNRRGLWELIRKYKKGRTIILTTHFMEEADALSDRIAIMNHGEVKCCGSPLYLKNTFGSGYRLTISKTDIFNENAFMTLIRNIISNFKIETNIAREITVAISYQYSNKLSELLDTIEKQKEIIGVSNYGISSSTIEEVFLKIGGIDKNGEIIKDGEEENDSNGFASNQVSNDLANAFVRDAKENKGVSLQMQQIRGLLTKRFLIFIRRYIVAMLMLLLPLVLNIVVCAVIPSGTNLINSIRGQSSTVGSYKLGVENYAKQKLPYSLNITNDNITNLINSYFGQQNKSSITLDLLTNDTVDAYVLAKRKSDIKNLVFDYFAGFSVVEEDSKFSFLTYYSSMAYHSSANMIHEISNLLLAYYNSNSLQKTITTYNVPISANDSRSRSTDYLNYLACIDSFPLSLFNFLSAIIIAFIICSFVILIARERINGSKTLQLLSGTHYMTYWIANHIFDLTICFFNAIILVVSLKIVDSIRNDSSYETYVIAQSDNLGCYFLLLFFSSFTWTTLAYIWSYLFQSEIVGFIVLLIVLCLGAFLDTIWSFLELLIQSDTGTVDGPVYYLMLVIRWVLTFLLPNVTVKRGLYNFKIRDNSFCIEALNRLLNKGFKQGEPQLSMNEPGIGLLLLLSVIYFIIGNFIIVFIEKKWSCTSCFKGKQIANVSNYDDTLDLEEDVATEFQRIKKSDLNQLSQHEPLIVNDLVMKFKKKKKNFLAVNHLCFGIENKECFGLLGLNGAGKTTTFKILIGELNPTSGSAFINTYQINKDRFNARRRLGFCPQFDYLPEYLTVTQTFYLFARLRGVMNKQIKKMVDDYINVFKLNEFSDKLVQKLSGGNKRKVSAAIAFIGAPSVIILDEPTTGMDPAAKRYLWTVITKARDIGMTIVLTSHSMEECEALCTRLGIMVNGQMQCLGSVQHLKSKFGKGYSLIVKSKFLSEASDERVAQIDTFLRENIKFLELKDEQAETLYYQISIDNSNTNVEKRQTLAQIFSIIETNKDRLNIEAYSISQTTLEDVFLSFARLQRTEEELLAAAAAAGKSIEPNEIHSQQQRRSLLSDNTANNTRRRTNGSIHVENGEVQQHAF